MSVEPNAGQFAEVAALAGGISGVDLRPKLRLHRLRCGMAAEFRHASPEEPVVVGKARRLRRAGQGTPAVLLLLRVQREVHADIKRRIARLHVGQLRKPRARHHHRASGADAAFTEVEERRVGAVAHAEIVGMNDDVPG